MLAAARNDLGRQLGDTVAKLGFVGQFDVRLY
jgi:hypothetical protein